MTPTLKQAIDYITKGGMEADDYLHYDECLKTVITAAEHCEKLEAQRAELREWLNEQLKPLPVVELGGELLAKFCNALHNAPFKAFLDKLNEQEGPAK